MRKDLKWCVVTIMSEHELDDFSSVKKDMKWCSVTTIKEHEKTMIFTSDRIIP
jgi:hypothetical protein